MPNGDADFGYGKFIGFKNFDIKIGKGEDVPHFGETFEPFTEGLSPAAREGLEAALEFLPRFIEEMRGQPNAAGSGGATC